MIVATRHDDETCPGGPVDASPPVPNTPRTDVPQRSHDPGRVMVPLPASFGGTWQLTLAREPNDHRHNEASDIMYAHRPMRAGAM